MNASPRYNTHNKHTNKKTADHLNESVRTNKTDRGTYRIAFGFSIHFVAVFPLFVAPHSIGHQTVPTRFRLPHIWESLANFSSCSALFSHSYIPITTHWQVFSNGKLFLTKPHRFGTNSILTLTYENCSQVALVCCGFACCGTSRNRYVWVFFCFNVLAANKRQDKLRLNGIATVDKQSSPRIFVCSL